MIFQKGEPIGGYAPGDEAGRYAHNTYIYYLEIYIYHAFLRHLEYAELQDVSFF